MDKPKARPRSRFRNRSIPAVAERLGMPAWELRRAVRRKEVESFLWNGLPRIPPAEERRIKALAED